MMEDLHPSDRTATQATVPIHPIHTAAREICVDLVHSGDLIPTAAQALPLDPHPSYPIPTAAIDLHPCDPILTTAQAIPIEDVLSQAFNKVEADHQTVLCKIHRFPVSLREFCEERHYIVPKLVAIGPYHRHLPELQEMEEIKKAAAYSFFKESLENPSAKVRAYNNVLDVAGAARRCYDAYAIEGVSDADFVTMMFYDACFLMQIIAMYAKSEHSAPTSLLRRIRATIHVVMRDIFLLENQIPWLVLEAIGIHSEVDLSSFIVRMGMNFQSRLQSHKKPLDRSHKPSHLLGLLHFYQSGSKNTCQPFNFGGETSLPLGTSAIELAEIGITLSPSSTTDLKDIRLTKGSWSLFRKLSLPSLFLDQTTACWILNMAAFETCTFSLSPQVESLPEYAVSSYLYLVAMLMDRQEDAHELRAKQLIHGDFTNQQMLDFFKGSPGKDLGVGGRYFDLCLQLEEYKQKCWMWIAIHKFVYNNFRTIVTVLSIISVLVGLFKTLLSLQRR